jgi:hypothetical protein
VNKSSFYGLICFLGLAVGCSDITDPEKLESKVFVAPWAVGEWEIQNDKSEKITITIYPDGSVLGSDKSIGSWFFVEKDLYITWMDGWMDMIKWQDGHYEKFGYEPGTPPDLKATNQSEAIKIKSK